jgi:hypothetical protein
VKRIWWAFRRFWYRRILRRPRPVGRIAYVEMTRPWADPVSDEFTAEQAPDRMAVGMEFDEETMEKLRRGHYSGVSIGGAWHQKPKERQ